MIFCNLDSETNLMFANVKLKDKFMELWQTSVASTLCIVCMWEKDKRCLRMAVELIVSTIGLLYV